MSNELNYVFGPKLPSQLEVVGLAFVAAPNLQPDSAIASLSAERYARQNYDHLERDLQIFAEGTPERTLNVSVEIPPPAGVTNPTGLGGNTFSGSVTLTSNKWSFNVINTAIRVTGIHMTKANTWCPLLQPGTVWRTQYTLATSGIEPANSWLRKAIPEDNQDHKLILIYSVPEYRYNTEVASAGLKFPPDPAKFITIKEIGSVIGPNKISWAGSLDIVKEVVVNGVTQFSGTFTGVESDDFLKGINKTLKTIDIAKSLGPDDYVELTYLSYASYYIYSGFRDASGSWYPFDANPEYGHIIGDDQTQEYRQSADALLEQATLYAIPSAAMEYIYTESAGGTGQVLGTLQLRFYRGIDYGETHFVRHIISGENIETIDSRDGSTIINTWGYATFGRNYYDEQNQIVGDIFSNIVPSMIPLGKFVLAAPAAIQSVSVADIRQRGGGVPPDFPMAAVETEENGLDTLRGFLDLGIWEGKAIKEGGVIEIEIDISLLKTDPNDTDPNTFLADEIYQEVKKQVPPGIDFVIKYIEF